MKVYFKVWKALHKLGKMNARKLHFSLALGLGLTLTLSLFVLISQAALAARPLLRPGNPVIHPAGNTYTAPPNTTVSITYDEPISSTTVSTQTFAVHAMQTGLLMQTYGVYSGTISLTPTQPLKPGELVQASATTGTLSIMDGQGPISPTVWSFRVAILGGSGVFTDSGQSLGSSYSQDVVLGDVDGDGDLDAFVANGDGGQVNAVWLNDGTGGFTDSGQNLGSSTSLGVALGDVDSDGDLDAFVANYSGQANKVWLNDGTGSFSDSGQSLGSADSAAVALGDLDGDGDLDAFVGNHNWQGDKVWLNDGTGNFTDSGQSLGSEKDQGVALGDLDGDGDLDAVTVNAYDGNKVWLNDGGGNFSDSGQSLGSENGQIVALGDVDGDGDLDAFIGHYGAANRVWLNDGTGSFTDSGQSLGSSHSGGVALGDVDGDGDLDAFVANYHSQANRVWLNDGLGTFSDSNQSLGSSDSVAVALGDVDGDGDLDAFVANGHPSNHPNKVWLNQGEPAGVRLIPPVQTGQGVPGQVVAYEETLINATGATDSFSLTPGSHAWDTALSADVLGPIAHSDSVTFTVYVTVPVDADLYLTDTVVVTATSVASPTVYSDTATFTTQAYGPPQMGVSFFAASRELYGYDVPAAWLRVVGTQDDTHVRVVNLDTATVIDENTDLDRYEIWDVYPSDGTFYKVEADKPVVGYESDLDPTTGLHTTFIPSLDSGPVGTEFIFYYLRTGHELNAFYVFAVEDASVEVYDASGSLVVRPKSF